jgi:YspA, cpYpsA-related SLOG family
MRIVIAGDRFWNCNRLAEAVLRRLIARYGPDTVIVLGGGPGVEWAFSEACERLEIAKDVYLADFAHVADYRYANRELLGRGAGLCVIVHRAPLDDRSRDLARQAIAAGVPTYLIDSEEGKPKLGLGTRRWESQ